jgi:hypothetical protein
MRSMTLFKGFCNIDQYLTAFSMCAVSDLDFIGKSSATLELKLEIKELSTLN